MDPNRALDIVLDVFIAHVSTHYAFFLALLRQSPWCRKHPDARRNSNENLTTSSHNLASERDNASKLSSKMDGLSSTDGPTQKDTFENVLRSLDDGSDVDAGSSAPICAQVIGFKFVHYQVRSAVMKLGEMYS